MAPEDARKQSTGVWGTNMPKDKAAWDQSREEIYRLYILDDLSLKGVKHALETKHGFPEFRLRDYEIVLRDYFKFRKNLRSQDWQAVAIHREQRLQRGEQSDVYLYGCLLEKARVDRAVRRSRHKWKLPYRVRSDPVPPLPDGVTIQTPSPVVPRESVPPRTIAASDAQFPHGHYNSQLMLTESSHLNTAPAMITTRWQIPVKLSVQEMRLHIPFTQFIETTAMAIYKLAMPTPSAQSSTASVQSPVIPNLPHFINILGHSPHMQFSEQTSTLTGPLRETIERHLHSRAALRSMKSLSGRFPFERIMYLFSMMSNKKSIHKDDVLDLFEWIESAEVDVLKSLFALPLPTMTAAWEFLIEQSTLPAHPIAFQKLVEVSLLIRNGQWLKARAGDILGLAIWLGLNGLTRRLLHLGLSPNAEFTVTDYSMPLRGHSSELFLHGTPLEAAISCANPAAVGLLIEYCAELHHGVLYHIFGPYTHPDPEFLAGMFHCLRLLLEAGAPADTWRFGGPMEGSLLSKLGWADGRAYQFLDMLWQKSYSHSIWKQTFNLALQYSERMKTSLTVAGLCNAASLGHKELLQHMADRTDLSSREQLLICEIALSEAAHEGDWNACQSFLQIGVDPNVENYGTEFSKSADVGGLHFHRLDLLIKPRAWSFEKRTPVYGALKRGNMPLLDLFLEAGADINRYNILDALFNGDAYSKFWTKSPSVTCPEGEMAADCIPAAQCLASSKLEQTFDFLIGAGLDFQAHGKEAMARAMLTYVDSEVLFLQWNWLHSKGVNWDFELEGLNLIHFALRFWYHSAVLDVVEFLVSRGVSIHSNPCRMGHTMLHDAVSNAFCELDVIDFLLANGVDVHRCTQQGETVLDVIFACRRCYSNKGAICRRLLQLGAPLIPPQQALGEVVQLPILSLLLAVPEIEDSLILPFIGAARCATLCHDAEFATEIEHGFHEIHDWSRERSPLQAAITARRFILAKELLRRGAGERYFISPLVTALQSTIVVCARTPDDPSSIEFLRLLIDSKAEINAHAGDGLCALHHAAVTGSLNILGTLLENGADPNVLVKIVHFKLCRRLKTDKGPSYEDDDYNFFYRHPSQAHLEVDEIYEYDDLGRPLFMHPSIRCIDKLAPLWVPRALDLAAMEGRLDVIQMLLNAGGISGHSLIGPYDGAIECANEHRHHAIACLLQEANLQALNGGASFQDGFPRPERFSLPLRY
ncbi:hypothetical protein PFICI_01976 [Pestalotiopsis fici W106-1]|uniref:Clr5 domain-containing protein n=1 Tax=Pestalotiopsis fici (strain W106-1 / CGMCC3.15140) TaxID=1229662 RepID=W3XQ19_PESFW|nr:uncharacterized protein PFICI_01976 [Pestalotiopsis fici W106-1]ETS88148.1 hypothetical protein PFICI_01976 [Pestalotiopsis fici W106-1]